ncbi:hypothetical protein O181_001269 [Austropuccinia psidii MF-1]|uniref:Uncharacterized protein n=1 Tax=Austropuccinia psidii MF-1 TaxID=1389203 RepID=A0A9Q3BA62_9BASI|nr:hypothetical protein [Austropuccinia psidii MF-1]
MPKPLAGVYELLLIHQELSVSGEDHKALRRIESIVSHRQGQKDKELVEEPKYFIYIPEEGVGNDPSIGERRPRSVQRQAQRTSEETERYQEQSRKGKRQSQLAQTLPTRVQDPQIGVFSHGQGFQYVQRSYGIHGQGAGNDEQEFSTQIVNEIKTFKSIIDVKLGNFDAKLNKLTSDINDLKNNDRTSAECYKLTTTKVESITNKCDRIESKSQVQDDEIEDLSISHIN